ncbi:carboxymuconolactone decarboxylase family protein [Leisingera methylohalidivorans]|uniref:Carboxymuconolactone decarboxylase-like domain-containing protein n=1 Tax=Leisingera methylohalidivorans DSM 14336 TaxID=999552 RepID=V9VZK5_9RHOB|nr:carboxymuconolactone decarboxylase family protein [Leisingera methylohalidivorans]AHD03224.1 hypothetical protein METH_16985 [Leisingera methylohalidivorans DSM 14336]
MKDNSLSQAIVCVEYNEAGHETRAFYDKARERLDVLLNALKVFGHHPEYGHVFTDTLLTILKDGVLPWKIKELLILKTTFENDCTYCLVQHERLAGKLGISASKIADLQGMKYETSEHFTDAERALLDFCRQLAQDSSAVSVDTWARIRQHWSDPEIVDAAYVTTFYVGVSKFISTLGIELEPEFSGLRPRLHNG